MCHHGFATELCTGKPNMHQLLGDGYPNAWCYAGSLNTFCEGDSLQDNYG